MSQEDFVVFARIKPKPEYYEILKAALIELLEPTLKEPHCLQFDVFEGSPPDGSIYFFERFTSKEALDFHLAQDYTQKVMSNYDEWLEGPKTFYTMRRF